MTEAERNDLAAMFARITRRLIELEKPLLERHGLTMWEYIVLSHLAREPVGTQLALARAIGYDKTRLIAVLDGLEKDGLIARSPDPDDRRARNVTLTPKGRRRHVAVRDDIRRMEHDVLGTLEVGDREALLAALPRLV